MKEKGLYPPPLGPLQVKGLGKVRRRRLIDHFGEVAFIKRASVLEIASVKGMTVPLAEKLSEHLRDFAV